ncbi:MAG: FecR family protein [Verrucomicrobiota bacterium]
MSLKSCLCLIGLTLSLALSLPAQTVRVLLVAGTADITPTGETVARPIVKGEAVTAGSTISTGADGRVVLTPMPGVKSIITPNSTITLESASEAPNPDATTAYAAVIDLKVGAVVSDLNKPADATYDYSIRTPRGLAGARGTVFTVGVNPAGIATVVVAHGTITLTFTDGRTASLTPGKVSITKPDGTSVEAEKIGDLSPEDQAIANTWTEITLEAINRAIDDGADLSPDALRNVIETAESLGVELTDTANTLLRTIQEKVDQLEETQTETREEETKTVITNLKSSTSDAISRFRATLTADQLATFDQLNSQNQALLVSINDPAITQVALAGDTYTGVPFTNLDLAVNLRAIADLDAASLAFLKEANGENFENEGPGPADWSPAAFVRSAVTWNALSATDRQLLLDLDASEAVMDRSATFISAYLDQVVRALEPEQLTALLETGWGTDLLDNYFRSYGVSQNENAVAIAVALTADQRALIRYFDFDAEVAGNLGSYLAEKLDVLAGLTETERAQLRQFDLGDRLLDYSDTSVLQNALGRFNALTTAQQTAVKALGLGQFYLQPGDQQVYLSNDTITTVDARILDIVDTYLGLDQTRQEALRDAELFDTHYGFLGDERYDPANLTAFVDQYLTLPARTRAFILAAHDFSILDLLDGGGSSSAGSGSGVVLFESEGSYRSLGEFAAMVAALTDAELLTLRDIEGAAILAKGLFYEENPLQIIKTAIQFYNNLNVLQKFTLRELGILQQDGFDWLTVNQTGLTRLLGVYGALSGELRAGTEFIDYGNYPYYPETLTNPTFFISDDIYFYNVSFHSPTSTLNVAALKNLNIYGANDDLEDPTFNTAANGSLHLNASDLIDLNGVSFGTNIRSITMEAATINLANVHFNNGSVVALNSRDGGNPNFGSSITGRINFITNVKYAGHLLDSQEQFDAYGINIKTGTLANPATPGTYQTVTDYIETQ